MGEGRRGGEGGEGRGSERGRGGEGMGGDRYMYTCTLYVYMYKCTQLCVQIRVHVNVCVACFISPDCFNFVFISLGSEVQWPGP